MVRYISKQTGEVMMEETARTMSVSRAQSQDNGNLYRKNGMMNEKNRSLLNSFLNGDNSYSKVEIIYNNNEIRSFIIELFKLTDEFHIKNKQPGREELRKHLSEVQEFVCDLAGSNSKLALDVAIEISNQECDLQQNTDYYDDLLKLRAAICFEDE